MKNFILEACVDSVESAVIATRAGANRLELCSNLMIGGTTPTLATFRQVRKRCNNRIHVLIRPRFGDFCYSPDEFDIIREEVIQFREAGADGVVIGILKPDGTLNTEQMSLLMKEAGSMSVTLHRAFDVCKDPMTTFHEAKKLGIQTILTSGQEDCSLHGTNCIRNLIQESNGTVDILVGSGVDANVIPEIYKATGAYSYHMSGKTVLESPMQYRTASVHMGLDSISEYEIWQTSEEKIRAAVHTLEQL